MFVNTLTADNKYSLCNGKYLAQPIQLQSSKKLKKILNLLLHVSNLYQVLNILKKRMTLIGFVFPKVETAKDLVS